MRKKGSPTVALVISTGLVATLVLYAVVWLKLYERVASGRVDFISCYTAGKILIAGKGGELYNLKLQSQIQQSLLKGQVFEGGVLAYVHPPFQALVFLPFSYLSFPVAYSAWSVFMSALGLFSISFLLKLPHYQALRPWSTQIFLATFCFFPVFISLVQGQDSLMLLFFIAWAFTLLKQKRDTQAGIVLACALFKFHLVLIIYGVLLVKKRWRVIRGSIYSSLGLLVLSYATVGFTGIVDYVKLVSQMASWTGRYNFNPLQMRNLRGMLTLLLGGNPPMVTWLSLILGVFVLAITLRAWKGPWDASDRKFDLQSSLLVIAGLLVGHYLYSHDQSILVLPLFILLSIAQNGSKTLRTGIFLLLILANPALMFAFIEFGRFRIPINVLYLLMLFASFVYLTVRKLEVEKPPQGVYTLVT